MADTVDSLGAALRGSDSNKLASETAAAAQRLINATFNTPKNALAVLSQAGLQKLR